MRSALHKAAPAKLVGKGRFRGFARRYEDGRLGGKFSGLTKRLERLESDGALPALVRQTVFRRSGRAFRGPQGGRKRGMAIHRQLVAIAKGRPPQRLLRPAKLAIAYLERKEGVRLVTGELPVACDRLGIATAVDLVGVRTVPDLTTSDGNAMYELVLIEVKTGYDQGRTAPARRHGTAQNLRAPLHLASDCLQNRHLAQLAATTALFQADRTSIAKRLSDLNICWVKGLLVYATDEDVQACPLDPLRHVVV